MGTIGLTPCDEIDDYSADISVMEVYIQPTLSLICPRCANVFSSAMQMDPAAFAEIGLDKMLECCPKCFHVARFQRSDYLFRSDP